MIKHIMDARKISTKNISPKQIQHRISSLKNKGISPAEFEQQHQHFNQQITSAIITIYPEYEIRMRKNNALDFDDLLLKTLEIFNEFPEVLEKYQNRFTYILIDEYQDTNYIQYQIIKKLAQKHKNIFVVGDDDQSIYKWRGAEVLNIFRLIEDFPEVQKFRLEQNYRSTPEILNVANVVIRNNTTRMDKELWTEIPSSDAKPVIMETQNGKNEAEKILQTIMDLRASYGYDYGDFAILYRTNAQSRYFEEALIKKNIPYVIFGGKRFYDRKEIKDVLAYLKFFTNPSDLISLERIINVPSRKIGEATLRKLYEVANSEQVNVEQIFRHFEQYKQHFRNPTGLVEFSRIFVTCADVMHEMNPLEFFDFVLEKTGLLDYYEKESQVEGVARIENIEQLRVAVKEFIETYGENSITIEDFLNHVTLLTDVDNPHGNMQGVKLLTVHAAKGLEFPVVFVVGLEERLFPHVLSLEQEEDLEEERRLFYVAVTRSQERLYLSYAKWREMYGNGMEEGRKKSRFLDEIPGDLVKFESYTQSTYYYGNSTYTRRYSTGSRFREGEWVIHPEFGRGQIVGIEGRGTRETVRIVFEDGQLKTFFSQIARLEKE